jgi:hypothetical protein
MSSLQGGPEPSPEWDDATADPAHAPAPAAPSQLSLFVFEDVPAAAPRPRLRRLKTLLSGLDPSRDGPAPPAQAPAPLWPDSFFD